MLPTPILPEPTDPARQRDADAQYYRQVLHELIEIGTDLARALHRTATAEPAPQPGAAPAATAAPDLAIAFDRIARTLRRTIALARKLSEPAPPSAASRAAEGFQQRRLVARKQIIRAVEDSIQREAEGPEAEALHAELYERLDTLDLDDDIESLPIPEIIAAIRRDLGIAAHLPGTHPWKRRTPGDVRDLRARAARPVMAQPTAAQPRAAQPTRTSTGPPAP